MKAIQTVYSGYKFRSRLEARWAVFFEHIGLNWEYESVGLVLEDGSYYLPDFTIYRLDENPVYYEIKPKNFKGDVSGAQLLIGDPYHFLGLDCKVMCPRCGGIGIIKPISTHGENGTCGYWTQGEMIYDCYDCDMETPCGGGNPPISGFNLEDVIYPHKGALIIRGYDAISWDFKFRNAIIAARQARFEHGENPK